MVSRPLIGSPPQTENTNKPLPEDFRRLIPLWRHMTGIYGHKWVSSFGEEVNETWVRGCKDLSNDELARGLRACLKTSETNKRSGDDDWPPTLGEFRLLCKPYRAAAHDELPALPAPKLTDSQLQGIDADIATLRKQIEDDGRQQDQEVRTRREERFKHSQDREPGEEG